MAPSFGWRIPDRHYREAGMVMMNEEIERVLEGVDSTALLRLIDDPTVEEKDRADIIGRALRALEEQFYEHLPELVVRICVEAPEKVRWRVRHSFLSYWLKGQGYYQRARVIQSLIERLKSESDERLEAAIRTAWVVGYRDEQIVNELENIAGLRDRTHRDKNAEGWSLAVLPSIAYPNLDLIASKLQSRLKTQGHLAESDCWTARHAATP